MLETEKLKACLLVQTWKVFQKSRCSMFILHVEVIGRCLKFSKVKPNGKFIAGVYSKSTVRQPPLLLSSGKGGEQLLLL